MNLYKISQNKNTDYEVYYSAVVAAESEEEATMLLWVKDPKDVSCELIGLAKAGTPKSVICADFSP